MIVYINARLNAWAEWKLQRIDGGSVVSATWLMMRQGGDPADAPPPASRVPIDDLECCDTDRCVCALNEVLQQAVSEFYLKTGTTIEQKARRCGCCEKTLYNRVHQAHALILGYLNDLSAGVPVAPWQRPAIKKVA